MGEKKEEQEPAPQQEREAPEQPAQQQSQNVTVGVQPVEDDDIPEAGR